jgi:hypothetical protein
MCSICFSFVVPSELKSCIDEELISATSPSSKRIIRFVNGMNAGMSEATKFSLSPTPMTRGLFFRATISFSGFCLFMTTNA